jgi:hypothetical protein
MGRAAVLRLRLPAAAPTVWKVRRYAMSTLVKGAGLAFRRLLPNFSDKRTLLDAVGIVSNVPKAA